MALVDWGIVAVLVLTMLGGLSQGFFRSAFSLAGLLAGFTLAAWNYGRAGKIFMPLVRLEPIASALGFLAIVLIVIGIAVVLGRILSKIFHYMGLGCLDRIAGAIFGFFQGAVLVTLVVIVTAAFFPSSQWLTDAKLPRLFFGACHLTARVSPEDLAQRLRMGLQTLEDESPQWLHQDKNDL
jgi:membrane protein required for colicin V production